LVFVLPLTQWSVLHPEYKLQYFTDAGWAPDWIAEARSLVTMEWTSRYRPVALLSAAEEVPESSSGNVSRSFVQFVYLPLISLSAL
jgi:hypothetical protein